MRKYLFFITAALLCLAYQWADELVQYGISSKELKEYVVSIAQRDKFPGLNFYIPQSVRQMKGKMTDDQKTALAKTACTFVKAYVNSSAFVSDLNSQINSQLVDTRPESDYWKEIYQSVYNSSIEEITSLKGFMNDAYFESMQQMNSALQSLLQQPNTFGDTPEGQLMFENETRKLHQNIAEMEALTDKDLFLKDFNAYANKLATLKARHATDNQILDAKAQNEALKKGLNYKTHIQQQLQQFLDESENVDFNAKLVANGSMLEFENPEYKSKSLVWKQCFRMGKPGTDVFRKFAEDWLKEL